MGSELGASLPVCAQVIGGPLGGETLFVEARLSTLEVEDKAGRRVRYTMHRLSEPAGPERTEVIYTPWGWSQAEIDLGVQEWLAQLTRK